MTEILPRELVLVAVDNQRAIWGELSTSTHQWAVVDSICQVSVYINPLCHQQIPVIVMPPLQLFTSIHYNILTSQPHWTSGESIYNTWYEYFRNEITMHEGPNIIIVIYVLIISCDKLDSVCCCGHNFMHWPGPWFNIKMPSYQYRKSHYGDKRIVRSSYLHNGISYTGKMTSLYWIKALGVISMIVSFVNKQFNRNQIIIAFSWGHKQSVNLGHSLLQIK